jgi:squalene-hopene/tetraprenyl-beta-curcumene cyclase
MKRHWQAADGGFPMYPGGKSDVSASVKAYFAFKLAGHSSEEPFMVRLRECILRLGGVTKCNTFTKLYLSIFGQYDWDGVPTIPPEFFFVPDWFYLNLYEMSSWSRGLLVPLAIINHYKPSRPVPAECAIDELFAGPRHGKALRLPWDKHIVSWKNFFLVLDRVIKLHGSLPVKPLRSQALKKSEKWILERQHKSGGLAAVFPAMTHATMAYLCLGYSQDSPQVQHELNELAKFEIEDGDEIRIQPCVSPVWDTALSLNALLDSGLPADDPSIKRAVDWLLSKQTTLRADWAVKVPKAEPGGWYFEMENEFYPDVDDTVMVLMGLQKASCPDGRPWGEADQPVRESMRKGLQWALAMQNRNGGWASFDKDNDKLMFAQVPFADHNAMLDPASVDITSRTLEMMGHFGYNTGDESIQKALRYIYNEQEADGSWYGRWGVNYIYGTWQTLRGLAQIGEDMHKPEVRRAVRWLKSVQNHDGGWGESCDSYEDPSLKGQGPSTASQTAWSLMGLINAGEADSIEVQRGLQYLTRTQREDGTWDEPYFTGTGFPLVFYLRYHYYRHYFPLWAMGQYMQAKERNTKRPAPDHVLAGRNGH